jgi:hypothetical protein
MLNARAFVSVKAAHKHVDEIDSRQRLPTSEQFNQWHKNIGIIFKLKILFVIKNSNIAN